MIEPRNLWGFFKFRVGGWGGWVGGWIDRKIEEEQMARMSYCEQGVGWVGGWGGGGWNELG